MIRNIIFTLSAILILSAIFFSIRYRISFSESLKCRKTGISRAVPISYSRGKYPSLVVFMLDIEGNPIMQFPMPKRLISRSDTLILQWCENIHGYHLNEI